MKNLKIILFSLTTIGLVFLTSCEKGDIITKERQIENKQAITDDDVALRSGCDWESPSSYISNYNTTAKVSSNMYGQPRTGCTPIGKMEVGHTGKVIAKKGDWKYLKVNDIQWAWVNKSAFFSNNCKWESPTSYISNYNATAKVSSNMYGQPRTGCTPIGKMEVGYTGRVIAEKGDWKYLKVNDKQWAWVNKSAFSSNGGTGSLSGINGYQWWDITEPYIYNLDSRIQPTQIRDNTYFAAGGWFNNDQGWYMGLQQKGDGTHTLHAAIWDSNSAVAANSANCSDFSGEGVGKKCWRNYNWSNLSSGYYKLRIWRLEEDNAGRWWGFWVITPGGDEFYIGKIRADKDADYIKSDTGQDHYNFIENWSHGSYRNCGEVPDARYYVYWPRFNNNKTGSIRINTSETNCVNVAKQQDKTLLEIE